MIKATKRYNDTEFRILANNKLAKDFAIKYADGLVKRCKYVGNYIFISYHVKGNEFYAHIKEFKNNTTFEDAIKKIKDDLSCNIVMGEADITIKKMHVKIFSNSDIKRDKTLLNFLNEEVV